MTAVRVPEHGGRSTVRGHLCCLLRQSGCLAAARPWRLDWLGLFGLVEHRCAHIAGSSASTVKEAPTIVTVWSRLVRLVANASMGAARAENDGERSRGHAPDLGRPQVPAGRP